MPEEGLDLGRQALPEPGRRLQAKGWRWNDKANTCLPPTSPADECRKKGGVWDGKRCLSPADACKARGWNWDGKSCKPPTASIVPRTVIPQ